MSASKTIQKETSVTYEGYRLKYLLLETEVEHATPFYQYGIQVLAYDTTGRLISQYCNCALTSNPSIAENLFHVVSESCVFPVHIDDVLSDSKETLFAPSDAIA